MHFHDYDVIADAAKCAYARGTKMIADMQYRLAELAGTGRLGPEESMALQWSLVRIWEQLYSGTTYAVRESVDYHDEFLAAGGHPADLDNHYSDGREVLTQDRIEPPQSAYPYSPFTLGDARRQRTPAGNGQLHRRPTRE
jgi:hypothetical protein